MATYRNPQLRDRLASGYVLGTLSGRARARFQSLIKYDPALRRLVGEWELRLTPMAVAAEEIAPPARLWRRIVARIGARPAHGWWSNVMFWRSCAIATSAAALALGIYLGMLPRPEAPIAMVAVMSDDRAQPAMVVSWPPLRDARDPHVRVRLVVEHPAIPPDASWQLWIVPAPNAAPIPLGLVSRESLQTIRIERSQIKNVWQSWGLALSVEPRGGSPTGAPTGPVIFKGRCLKTS